MPTVYCQQLKDISWSKGTDHTFSLSEGVAVWRVQATATPEVLKQLSTLLHPDELERAQRYHQEKDRQRFLISRGMLRLLLGRYMQKLPTDIQLKTSAQSKPFVNDAGTLDLHYNVTHAGNWILIAITNTAVGVDVEKLDDSFRYTDILPFGFSPKEINEIQKSGECRNNFYRYWTRKEALVKATAKGVNDQLAQIPSLDGLHTAEASIMGSSASWTVSSFVVDAQHVGSVACNPLMKNILFWDAGELAPCLSQAKMD